MKFKNIQEVFNYFRSKNIEEIESRAKEIKNIISTDASADIDYLNMELEGLKQAKENISERSQKFNPITGMNFNSSTIKDDEILESKEYRSAFLKSLLGQNLDETESKIFKRAMELNNRADAFSTTGNSTALLPTKTLNEIIEKARKQGGLLSECRNFNIPSNIAIPIGTPSDKAKWHTEGQAVDSEKVTTTSITFKSYEIIKIFSISVNAKKMTIDAFENYLINELTNCVMECIADALINGTGKEQGTGLLTGITWDTTNSLSLTGSYTDFTKALAILKRGYSQGAKWVMSNATLYNTVYSLVDTTGKPLFTQDLQHGNVGYILGKPIIIDDNIPDETILLGNFNYMGYNIPQGIVVEASTQSSFKSGLIDYRAMAIADTKPLIQEAFIKLSKSK